MYLLTCNFYGINVILWVRRGRTERGRPSVLTWSSSLLLSHRPGQHHQLHVSYSDIIPHVCSVYVNMVKPVIWKSPLRRLFTSECFTGIECHTNIKFLIFFYFQFPFNAHHHTEQRHITARNTWLEAVWLHDVEVVSQDGGVGPHQVPLLVPLRPVHSHHFGCRQQTWGQCVPPLSSPESRGT